MAQQTQRANDPSGVRIGDREGITLSARLSYADDGEGESLTIWLRNISAGGLGGECEETIRTGAPVVIELVPHETVHAPIPPVTGWVAWVKGRRFGIAFDSAIDPSSVLDSAFATASMPLASMPSSSRRKKRLSPLSASMITRPDAAPGD